MTDKPNLLIVGDYNRTDYLNIFRVSFSDFNFYFLEFSSPQEIHNPYYKSIGKAIFWGDYKDALKLVDKVNPQKVLFYFIESYYHLALNLACKVKGIPTYHIDHGIRDVNVNIRLEKYVFDPVLTNSAQRVLQKLTQLRHRIKARLFLLNTIKNLPEREAAQLTAYIKIRRRASYWETIKKIQAPYRLANAYISISPKTQAVHQFYDKIPSDKKVHFIGFPVFDHLATVTPMETKEKIILFIEQGYAYRNLYGWDLHSHWKLVSIFSEICARYGYYIKVKPHPRQPTKELAHWKQINIVELIEDKDIPEVLRKTELITGFFSTYHLPIIALPHTTLLTLENHPIGKIDVSKSFIEAGVAHPIYEIEKELPWALENITILHQQQKPNKAKFTQEWLYKFDGKAGERLRDILLTDNL